MDHAADRGYVYRLSIAQGPEVVTTLPAIVARGEKTSVEIVGWGVKTGADAMESTTLSIAVPKDAGETYRHPFDTPAGKAVANIIVAEESDTIEPTSDEIVKRILTVPTRLTGAFDKLDATLQQPVERFRLTAKKGDSLRFRVVPAVGAPPIDASIAIFDSLGVEIVRNDDMLVGVVDPVLNFTAKVDGDYDVLVLDASGNEPSQALLYRLLVDDLTTAFDFSVTVPEFFNVAIGDQADLVTKTSSVRGKKTSR